MDIVSKKEILELESLCEQRTRLFTIKQSAATVRDSTDPLRGWICHVCAHFNTPSTLASPNGPCQTCNTPACDAECADGIVIPRDNPHCSGFICWYCKYYWAWPEDEDEERIKDGVMSCTVCGDLEGEEVVFIKSWFEKENGAKGPATEEEQKQEQEKVLVLELTKDEKEEEKAKIDEVDDGEGAFTVVDRKRAKSKKKSETDRTNDSKGVFTKAYGKSAKPKKKIPENLLGSNGIPQYALRKLNK